ncbi:MAG: amidohydrolase family protein [Vicinamibacterales bacterium]
MSSTAPLEDGVVLVAGDTIVHVGERGEVALPEEPGIEAIDASGQWVIPGLMDLHTHPGSYEGDEQRDALETLLALGISDRLGSLEAGKLADLVVLSADPHTDIANARAITIVVKGGRVFRPQDLLSHRR